jgi:hypothetical protein
MNSIVKQGDIYEIIGSDGFHRKLVIIPKVTFTTQPNIPIYNGRKIKTINLRTGRWLSVNGKQLRFAKKHNLSDINISDSVKRLIKRKDLTLFKHLFEQQGEMEQVEGMKCINAKTTISKDIVCFITKKPCVCANYSGIEKKVVLRDYCINCPKFSGV